MKVPVLLITAILPLSATPESSLIPETWFQNLTATDGSTQQCIIFTTIPGVEYTFFHSNNLKDWTEAGETYGLGQEFAAAMRETAPAQPPPAPDNPPVGQPVPVNASITIQPSSGTAGGTVVSWASHDHGNSVRSLIPGNAVAEWQSDPFFAAIHGGHQFFIQYIASATAPPGNNPPLDANDAAMIADLEAGWADINAAVAIAAAANCNTPTPSEEGTKGFWRIKADWSLDSDNDGSPDHLEFDLAAQAPGAGGLAGNAFNADTNNDGIPDGEQLDADGDGIPDAKDIAPDDGGVAYSIVALPRYAMFMIEDTAMQPFAINDRGTALGIYSYWKNGEAHDLITDELQIPGYPISEGHEEGDAAIHARAINDNDQVIGAGIADLEDTITEPDRRQIHPVIYWSAPQVVPAIVSSTAGSTITYSDRRSRGNYYAARHLDNSGSFYSPAVTWDLTRPDPGPKDADDGWKKWTLPPGGGPITLSAAPEGTKGTAAGGIVWGSTYGDSGEWLQSNITAPFSAEIPVNDPDVVVAQSAGGNILVASPYADPTMVRKGGEWLISPLLENVRDIADDGTAIGKGVPSENLEPSILLNGKWTSLERAVPGIPEHWKTSADMWLSDTSPGGWILARDHPSLEENISAALLPLRLKGRYTDSANNVVDRAVGVDDFSIGSSDPSMSLDDIDHVQERIWVMAPLGGQPKSVVLDAPIHASAPATISADGILFGGQEEAVCDSPETTLSVAAAPGFITGEEKLIDLKIGTSVSISRPVGFKVMKARAVKVVVWRVFSDKNPEGTMPEDPGYVQPVGPHFNPTEEQLENHFNDLFTPQINTTFDCELRNITVRFDTANGEAFGAPADKVNPFDGILDITVAGLDTEFDAVRAEGHDATRSINLYILGDIGYISGNYWSEVLGILAPKLMYGIADPANRIAAVCGNSYEPWAHLIDICGHEIGHILVGEGHPDTDSPGVAPLPDTRHIERLMCSGPKRRGDGYSRLLVKREWDAAEKWLIDEMKRLEELEQQ